MVDVDTIAVNYVLVSTPNRSVTCRLHPWCLCMVFLTESASSRTGTDSIQHAFSAVLTLTMFRGCCCSALSRQSSVSVSSTPLAPQVWLDWCVVRFHQTLFIHSAIHAVYCTSCRLPCHISRKLTRTRQPNAWMCTCCDVCALAKTGDCWPRGAEVPNGEPDHALSCPLVN